MQVLFTYGELVLSVSIIHVYVNEYIRRMKSMKSLCLSYTS